MFSIWKAMTTESFVSFKTIVDPVNASEKEVEVWKQRSGSQVRQVLFIDLFENKWSTYSYSIYLYLSHEHSSTQKTFQKHSYELLSLKLLGLIIICDRLSE